MTTKEGQTETCFSCKGRGTVTSTVHCVGFGPDVKTVQTYDIPCLICKGAKVMPKGYGKEWRRNELKFWCRCAKPGEPVFHDDGVCRQCDKHHYHCSKCGKIQQVG